ncbi:MAG: beta-ketoacyl-[acyl-carrier-protein] synthase family protein [Planctomycetales bacterium]|nr:beta-ketoacyl-[acyl-carrier-protein] synthase family protein [Planctomycetales bacterium]
MASAEPIILRFPQPAPIDEEPIVITGIGIAASIGSTREQVWQGIQQGICNIRRTTSEDGVGQLTQPCAMIDWLEGDSTSLKSVRLSEHVADEALADADIPWSEIDRSRFACSISAQFGDIGYVYQSAAERDKAPLPGQHRWWDEFLPCSASTIVARRHNLQGPLLCHTTACASGLVSTIAAARMLQSNQADFALCGASDAVTELVYSAFNRMGVLSSGPTAGNACRPFDTTRSGFVIGEGAAMMVLERKSTAIARGARIYAELAAMQTLCQAHHVTGLDDAAETLTELIRRLVHKAHWQSQGPQYINAHGTGTEQNDRSELLAIRSALGRQADEVVISSNKAVLGHLINAAGSIELALTALALRDGFAPPTMHLDSPERIGNLDCLPNAGITAKLDRALKLSLAFGGHLVGIALRGCDDLAHRRSSLPLSPNALVRTSGQQRLRSVASKQASVA